jgi:hypothetical protein
MKPLKYFFLTSLSLLTIVFTGVSASSLDDSSCSEYEFIFARGSGQSLDDVDYRTFKDKINDKLAGLNYEFYELGTANNGYPAYSPDGLLSVLGTYISAGESYKFGESVERGIEELISYIKGEIKRCKNKKYILAGYSQGAFVIDKALPYLNSSKIFYVATFGDPKLYLPEGKNKNACKNIGLSSYRVYVPDCEVEEGVLGGQNPYETKDLENKRGAWCNQNDFICGSNLYVLDIWKGHTSYVDSNGYEKFANIILNMIKAEETRIPETEARYSDYKKRDIILLYDYYDRLRLHRCNNCDSISVEMRNMLISLAEHGSRIAVYNYYTLANSTLRLEEMIPFTNDNFAEKLYDWNLENTLHPERVSGGGDNMYYAIKEVSKNGGWLDGAERNIFICRDNIGSSYVSFDGTMIEEAIQVAKDNNVKIYTFNNGGVTWAPMREIAEETGGEVIGTDFEKIVLNKNESKHMPRYSSKTFKFNHESKYVLVIINDMIYGLTDKESITVKNIDESRRNTIVFIQYDENGRPEKKETHVVGEDKLLVPDSGKLKL